jgi:hypothetical protein
MGGSSVKGADGSFKTVRKSIISVTARNTVAALLFLVLPFSFP